MKTGSGLRHFIIAFFLAVLLYVAAFHLIEHRRVSRGPWSVTFTNAETQPMMIINQPTLGISNIHVRFQAPLTNPVSETIQFGEPRAVPFAVPFGECIFLDPTFLPGTVTMRCFGHEIELIPRVLILDHKEHSWSEKVIEAAPKRSAATNASQS